MSLAVNQGHALLTVRDTGPGIDPRQLELIFEPYVRLGPEGQQPSGAGLGLYITKAIVDAHNGEIRVNSEIGRGTKFEVDLLVRGFAGGGAVEEGKPAVRP